MVGNCKVPHYLPEPSVRPSQQARVAKVELTLLTSPYGFKPNTSSSLEVPTKTCPLATVGMPNCIPMPVVSVLLL